MEHEKGRLTGKPIITRNLDALCNKHKGDEKARAMLIFAGLFAQAQAINQLLGPSPVAPLVRDTFSSLGAFVMERLGWEVPEFDAIKREFDVAAKADLNATMALRDAAAQVDAVEAQIREGHGKDEVREALIRAARKGDTLN